MDTISSAEFRKRYAKLTQPTRVTVLGRVIGEWRPANVAVESDNPVVYEHTFGPDDGPPLKAFNSKPFTPVPKSTKRR
jgi:DNA-binding beta-propeller fold protein YncE